MPSSLRPDGKISSAPIVVPCPRCGGRIVVVGSVLGESLCLTAGGTCTECGTEVYSALDLERSRL